MSENSRWNLTAPLLRSYPGNIRFYFFFLKLYPISYNHKWVFQKICWNQHLHWGFWDLCRSPKFGSFWSTSSVLEPMQFEPFKMSTKYVLRIRSMDAMFDVGLLSSLLVSLASQMHLSFALGLLRPMQKFKIHQWVSKKDVAQIAGAKFGNACTSTL